MTLYQGPNLQTPSKRMPSTSPQHSAEHSTKALTCRSPPNACLPLHHNTAQDTVPRPYPADPLPTHAFHFTTTQRRTLYQGPNLQIPSQRMPSTSPQHSAEHCTKALTCRPPLSNVAFIVMQLGSPLHCGGPNHLMECVYPLISFPGEKITNPTNTQYPTIQTQTRSIQQGPLCREQYGHRHQGRFVFERGREGGRGLVVSLKESPLAEPTSKAFLCESTFDSRELPVIWRVCWVARGIFLPLILTLEIRKKSQPLLVAANFVLPVTLWLTCPSPTVE